MVYKKYKEVILYIIFGICTTFVNIVVYYICSRILSLKTIESTIIAWMLSVIFAYITNKIYVFHSNKRFLKDVLLEIVSFVGCRLLSGIIDIIIMYAFVDIIGINDIIIKILSNIVIIVFNYVASKLFIFRK